MSSVPRVNSFASEWADVMNQLADPIVATGPCLSRKLGCLVRQVASRAGASIDARGAQIRGDSADVLGYPPARKFSMTYAAAECLWYLSGSRRGDMLVPWSSHYEERFAQDDGTCWGAYGPRLLGVDDERLTPLEQIADELADSPESRQCVAPIFSSLDRNVLNKRPRVRDMPCTLSLQFLAEIDGTLSLVTTMRSNDMWLGFPYDAFCFTTIQRLMALRLGLRPGEYVHQAGSLHLYVKNAPAWLTAEPSARIPLPADLRRVEYQSLAPSRRHGIFDAKFRDAVLGVFRAVISHAVRNAKRASESEPKPEFSDRDLEATIYHHVQEPYSPILSDLCWAAISRRFEIDYNRIQCPAIRDACKQEGHDRAHR